MTALISSSILNALIDIGFVVVLVLIFGFGWTTGYHTGHWRGRRGVKK